MTLYTIKHIAGEDVITAGSVHYGEWVKFYNESTPNKDLTPIYAVAANSIVTISQADFIVSSSSDLVETAVLMCRSELTTESEPLYTAPTDGSAIVKNIILTNTGNKSASVFVTLNGVALMSSTSVPVGSLAMFDFSQVMASGDVLAAWATPATVTMHASGTETSRTAVSSTQSTATVKSSTIKNTMKKILDDVPHTYKGEGLPEEVSFWDWRPNAVFIPPRTGDTYIDTKLGGERYKLYIGDDYTLVGRPLVIHHVTERELVALSKRLADHINRLEAQI